MVHIISIWLLTAGFLGAGTFNVIGSPATKSSFVRWGYPRWWNIPTGTLEITCAILLATHASRHLGLALGTAIIAAAAFTVLRHREHSHLPPLGGFAVLITLAVTLR